MFRKCVALLALALYGMFLANLYGQVAPEAVSTLAQPALSGAAGSYAPRFSGDGRFIVFLSHAPNLTTNVNPHGGLNVYVKELPTGLISLISANHTGEKAGNGHSSSPSVSSNGQFIVFESTATDLVVADTNGFKDIFIRDVLAGTTTLVTRDAAGTGSANGDSSNPEISPDGRYILFESSAENLVAGDTNRISDIFVYDRLNGTRTLVSVGARGLPGSAYGSLTRSGSASMTPDGQRVVFVSTATNLVPGVTNMLGEIYVRDLTAGATYWISSNSAALDPGTPRSFNPIISPDGRLVFYKTMTDQRTSWAFLRMQDLQSGSSTVIATNADPVGWPALSLDGSKIASESLPGQLAIWNTTAVTNTPLLLPVANAAFGPVFSPDGKRLAVLCVTNPLVSQPTFGKIQLYVFDLLSGQSRLASPRTNGMGSGDLGFIQPSFDPSGNSLAFESSDQGLVSGDDNFASDVFIYNVPSDSVELVSTRIPARPSRTGFGLSVSGSACVSANGRYVTFSTADTNIYATGRTNFFNLVVWDTWLRTNIVQGLWTNNADLEGGYRYTDRTKTIGIGPSISLDGKTLAYVTSRENSAANATSGDILALRLNGGQIKLATPPTQSLSTSSRYPSLSADGNIIAFESSSPIPTGIPDDTFNDVFVYDILLSTNRLVSINRNSSHSGNNASVNPVVSPDGRWVLFQSLATDLIAGLANYPANGNREFVRDLVTGNTYLLSFGSNGLPISGSATSHCFSLNSRVAAFGGNFDFSSGLSPAILIYDLYSRTNRLICTNCQNPSLNADGRWIAYQKGSEGSSGSDIFVQDLNSTQEFLVSVASLGVGGGNGASVRPLISPDGRYVVFASQASNLVPNDANGKFDIFVRDRILAKTTLLSRQGNGVASASGSSFRPCLSADGRTVVFQSMASDLAEGDFNGKRDVFVVRLGSGDADADGMDDDWELAYFNDLSRTGQADLDGDGSLDLEEFRSGTDPTNTGSVLRVLKLEKIGSEALVLIWHAVYGKTYRVQYKDEVASGAWQDLSNDILATSSESAFETASTNNHRFYRVVAVD